MRASLVDRFWAKVDRRDLDECWPWLAFKDKDGYGRFTESYKPPTGAHRFAYELMIGSIPSGLTVDHLCRKRDCVNPKHMELVTAIENVMRGSRARDSSCIHGHLYTDSNLRLDSQGSRHCRTCDLLNRDKRSAQRKAKRIERLGFDPGPRARFYVNKS